tara:strand:- start:5208 stop:5741 length:534 start_codon:yes stop_codon:yes gene_type:complete
MVVLLISELYRVDELDSYITWTLQQEDTELILLCPSKDFCDIRSNDSRITVKPFLTTKQARKISTYRRVDSFKYKLIRILRRGSSVGAVTEKSLLYAIQTIRKVKSVMNGRHSSASTSHIVPSANGSMASPHYKEVVNSLQKIHAHIKITRIEVFDLQDLKAVMDFADGKRVEVQII